MVHLVGGIGIPSDRRGKVNRKSHDFMEFTSVPCAQFQPCRGQFPSCHGRYSGLSLSISLDKSFLITVMTEELNGGSLVLVERVCTPIRGAGDYPCRRMQYVHLVLRTYCTTNTGQHWPTLAPDSSDASRLVTFGRWAWGFLEGQMDWAETTIGSRSSVTEGGPRWDETP